MYNIKIGNKIGKKDLMEKECKLFDRPSQMEPLIIDRSRPGYEKLMGLAHELITADKMIESGLPLKTINSMSQLVLGMNCYYSNLIEGHHTRPLEIEKALLDIEKNDDEKGVKDLSFSHIKADIFSQRNFSSDKSISEFSKEIHRVFYENLPEEMLILDDLSLIFPGEFRQREVSVGNHVAPAYKNLDDFLKRFDQVYGLKIKSSKEGGLRRLDAVIHCFAAHHRFVWVHPFLDGNGRVSRILLHSMLRSCGMKHSLWSVSRGFAKSQDEYKRLLADADLSRKGDLDGRGNLTEKGLIEFIEYGLKVAIDQANFMSKMFSLENMKDRIFGYFDRNRYDLKPESKFAIFDAFTSGEIERGEAQRVTGLSQRTARDVIGKLIEEGFLKSDSPKGKLRIGFPVHALGSFLPNLFPAGDMDFIKRSKNKIK